MFSPLSAKVEHEVEREEERFSAAPASGASPRTAFAVIGGGLAGCECALALARAGLECTLYEQKPAAFSPAHTSEALGELVCSNSFRSNDAMGSGVGLLKQEMRDLGSAVMAAADHTAVPAGKALAVDRDRFAAALTAMVDAEPRIHLVRRAVTDLDDPELAGKTVIVAAGPLASPDLTRSLAAAMSGAPAGSEQAQDAANPTGEGKARSTDQLYFYDAIAPIVTADSINLSVAFRGSRYGNDGPPPPYRDDALPPDPPQDAAPVPAQAEASSGRNRLPDEATDNTGRNAQTAENEGDYLNCPMTRPEYERFFRALLAADKVAAHAFEKEKHFEGCMPIESLAERGERTLTFGPLKPVGFTDPRTGRRPWALLQLRAENAERTAYNLVGCQTKMTYAAQAEVFRLVPGLEKAEFLRFGSMHRNTYVNAPACLNPDLSLKNRPHVFLAGQITGVEGYVESAACGLWLGLALAARARGKKLAPPPATTALGALLTHLQTPARHFQPSNVHFGLMPDLAEKTPKKSRKAAMTERGRADFAAWLNEQGPALRDGGRGAS